MKPVCKGSGKTVRLQRVIEQMKILKMRMDAVFKSALFGLCSLGLIGCADPAQSGTIRDKIREKAQERRAERQGSTEGSTEGSTGGSGTSGGATGDLQEIQMTVGGQSRHYSLYVPQNFNGGAVMVLHGGQGTGAKTAGMSGMSQWADQYGFLAVYPNAGERQWNDGRATTQSSINDVAFIQSVIEDLVKTQGLDRSRVYVSGISNGGMMVQKLACDSPGSFAAFAAIAANMPSQLQGQCQPSQGSDFMFFHGTGDTVMPYNGGEIKKSRRKGAGGAVLSADATLAFWSDKNHCNGTPSTAARLDAKNDGTSVDRSTYQGCSQALIAYRINDGGHTWPGSDTPSTRIAGNTSQEVGASQAMLQFFQSKGL